MGRWRCVVPSRAQNARGFSLSSGRTKAVGNAASDSPFQRGLVPLSLAVQPSASLALAGPFLGGALVPRQLEQRLVGLHPALARFIAGHLRR